MCVEDTHCQTAEKRATLSGLEDEGDQSTEPSVGLQNFPQTQTPSTLASLLFAL